MPLRGRGRGRGGSANRGRGRGGSRGRGDARGRGGARGRGFRGGFRGRGEYHGYNDVNGPNKELLEPPKDLDVNKNVRDYFLGNVTYDQHHKGQEKNRNRYVAAMVVMLKSGYEIPQNARVRTLAAAWTRNDTDMTECLLSMRSSYGLVEVLKAVSLLDAGRCARIVEKKIKRLQVQKTPVKSKTLGKLKSDLDNLNAMKTTVGSATSYVCRQVKKWVLTLTAQELEFYALHFSTEPWKKLTDICHFNPQTDFPMLPWFLPFCFGGSAPEDSLVKHCCKITADNVNELVKTYAVPYTHIKQHTEQLTDNAKNRVALYEAKLDTVLWYYEDLQCKEVDEAVQLRLNRGDQVSLADGKLMERLLTIRMIREGISLKSLDDIYFNWDWDRFPNGPSEPIPDHSKAAFFPDLVKLGQKRLHSIKLPLEAPIVVMGDASGSMEVAIRTSSIIAGLLTAITSAKLVFFDDENREAPFLPDTVEEVLNLAMTTLTGGGTTPAASLYPFYKNKDIVKTFIVVTDEEENGSFLTGEEGEDGKRKSYRFCPLFEKYYKEVYPAKLVFVSFLGQTEEGQMVQELRELGMAPLQYKFDKNRPDLSKLDRLFGLLSTETTTFDEEVEQVQKLITTKGIKEVFKELKMGETH